MFKHPSPIILFNLYNKIRLLNGEDKTILNLVEENNEFIGYALEVIPNFCLDDYTYDYLVKKEFHFSEIARANQRKKREQFGIDTQTYNMNFSGNIEHYLDRSVRYKFFRLHYSVNFGEFKGKSIKELMEMSPSRIEFYIHTLPWFALNEYAINKLRTLQSKFIFLQSTFILLNSKLEDARSSSDSRDTNFSVNHYDGGYMYGDPSKDRNENPWIDIFGEGDESDTAYWNTQ